VRGVCVGCTPRAPCQPCRSQEISDDLPYNDYYEYYGPDYRLHIQPSGMDNLNQPETLEKLKNKVFEHMKNWTPVPNVQMHVTPADAGASSDEEDDPDVRASQKVGPLPHAQPTHAHASCPASEHARLASPQAMDARVEHDAEFYSGGKNKAD
jgi:hypothetical protein